MDSLRGLFGGRSSVPEAIEPVRRNLVDPEQVNEAVVFCFVPCLTRGEISSNLNWWIKWGKDRTEMFGRCDGEGGFVSLCQREER